MLIGWQSTSVRLLVQKGSEHLLQERWQIFQFMKEHQSIFAIEKMCRVFQISRSGFYHWLARKLSTRTLSNQDALKSIQAVHSRSKQRYGSPKITIKLQKRGMHISRPSVARIMKTHGIKSIIQKSLGYKQRIPSIATLFLEIY